ncbi:hypothetical protein [Nocardioides sp. SYSU D00065]|uniref:hypothetical protein n=1 Tax=Nocardioides sp. SYSU D00065 TaxID=2817378 RepID=UPI001B33D77F|nr:hypothetical protein [Nocardioides sp. SYSU D00065]
MAVRSAGWVIGAVTGVVVGTLLALVTQDWQESREAADVARRAAAFEHRDVVPEPGDAVRALVEQDSRLAIDPLLADRVPVADRRRAEALLDGSPVPARIAYLTYPETQDEGYTSSGAAAQWRTAVGEEGHYVVLWDSGHTESGAFGLEEHYVESRTEGQPGPALVRLAEEMAEWEAEPLPTRPEPVHDYDSWGGIGGGLAAGALMGLFGVVPVFLLLRWFVGTRRREVS